MTARSILTTTLTAALALSLGLAAAPSVHAQQSAECGEERKVSAKALDEATWKRLNDIYEDVGEEKYGEAYAALAKLKERSGKDEYLNAVIENAMAQVAWAQGNYDAALRHFERTVQLDALPDKQHFALMYQIAQLYNMKSRHDDALRALDLWFCKVPPEEIDAHAYVLKASIYASKEDWPQVLDAIDQAIALSDEPKEPWYQLKLSAHFELEQFPQAADTLEVMIEHWPEKKLYWVQLSQTYYRLKQDDKALAVAAMAWRKDLMDSQADVLYVASLYASKNVPYKAAHVLEKGIDDGVVEPSQKHWTNVADNWYAAEEMDKSLVAYQKAGRAALDGKIDLRRGYILVDLERWEDARQALSAAISKGGLEDRKVGEAYLLKGMSEFELGNYNQAMQDLSRATRYEKSRAAAQQWINHMNEERARQAAAP